MIPIDLIIFDFDGVLVDSGKDIANAVNYTLKRFDKDTIDINTIVSYVGDGAESLLRRSFGGLSEEDMMKALPIYKQYYLEHCVDETTLYPNVIALLETFGLVKFAIATNKPEELTNSILEKFHIDKYFDMVIGPESVTKLKPNPEGIYKAMEALNVSSSRTLIVGDSDTDIFAGKSAGIYTCGHKNGLGDVKKLFEAQPDFIIEDIIEIKKYFMISTEVPI
jgi:phosphoglycolate phosphatase